MVITKAKWLEGTIARLDGLYSPSGEKLKCIRLTPEQVAEWNEEPAPEVLKTEPVVETIEEELREEGSADYPEELIAD